MEGELGGGEVKITSEEQPQKREPSYTVRSSNAHV